MTNYSVGSFEDIKKIPCRFNVVSLFAGGGGSSIGYRMAGGKVLAASELVDEAANTYEANWPNTKVIRGDVRELSPDWLLDAIGMEKGQLDLLDGSPPCSAFSTSGARDKNWGKTKVYSDVKQENVEDLFFEYIRILRGVMPRCFIAENVSGLAKGKARGYLNEVLRGLKDSGYHVECKLLDAKLLGVPQSRQRTIFVGVRSDLYCDDIKGRIHPLPCGYKVSLSEAFKGISNSEQDLLDCSMEGYKVLEYLKSLKPGEQHEKCFNLLKAHPYKPAGCITATGGCLSAAAVRHWDNRGFTIAEIKRIMSVPDDYILTGNYKKQAERLGRMVCPLMSKATSNVLVDLGLFNGDS